MLNDIVCLALLMGNCALPALRIALMVTHNRRPRMR